MIEKQARSLLDKLSGMRDKHDTETEPGTFSTGDDSNFADLGDDQNWNIGWDQMLLYGGHTINYGTVKGDKVNKEVASGDITYQSNHGDVYKVINLKPTNHNLREALIEDPAVQIPRFLDGTAKHLADIHHQVNTLLDQLNSEEMGSESRYSCLREQLAEILQIINLKDMELVEGDELIVSGVQQCEDSNKTLLSKIQQFKIAADKELKFQTEALNRELDFGRDKNNELITHLEHSNKVNRSLQKQLQEAKVQLQETQVELRRQSLPPRAPPLLSYKHRPTSSTPYADALHRPMSDFSRIVQPVLEDGDGILDEVDISGEEGHEELGNEERDLDDVPPLSVITATKATSTSNMASTSDTSHDNVMTSDHHDPNTVDQIVSSLVQQQQQQQQQEGGHTSELTIAQNTSRVIHPSTRASEVDRLLAIPEYLQIPTTGPLTSRSTRIADRNRAKDRQDGQVPIGIHDYSLDERLLNTSIPQIEGFETLTNTTVPLFDATRFLGRPNYGQSTTAYSTTQTNQTYQQTGYRGIGGLTHSGHYSQGAAGGIGGGEPPPPPPPGPTSSVLTGHYATVNNPNLMDQDIEMLLGPLPQRPVHPGTFATTDQLAQYNKDLDFFMQRSLIRDQQRPLMIMFKQNMRQQIPHQIQSSHIVKSAAPTLYPPRLILSSDMTPAQMSVTHKAWERKIKSYIATMKWDEQSALGILQDQKYKIIPERFHDFLQYATSFTQLLAMLNDMFPNVALAFQPLKEVLIGKSFYKSSIGSDNLAHKLSFLEKKIFSSKMLLNEFKLETKQQFTDSDWERAFLHLFKESELPLLGTPEWARFFPTLHTTSVTEIIGGHPVTRIMDPIEVFLKYLHSMRASIANLQAIKAQDFPDNTGTNITNIETSDMFNYYGTQEESPRGRVKLKPRGTFTQRTPSISPEDSKPRRSKGKTKVAFRSKVYSTQQECEDQKSSDTDCQEQQSDDIDDNTDDDQCYNTKDIMCLNPKCNKPDTHKTYNCEDLWKIRKDFPKYWPSTICKKCLESTSSHDIRQCQGTLVIPSYNHGNAITVTCGFHKNPTLHYRLCQSNVKKGLPIPNLRKPLEYLGPDNKPKLCCHIADMKLKYFNQNNVSFKPKSDHKNFTMMTIIDDVEIPKCYCYEEPGMATVQYHPTENLLSRLYYNDDKSLVHTLIPYNKKTILPLERAYLRDTKNQLVPINVFYDSGSSHNLISLKTFRDCIISEGHSKIASMQTASGLMQVPRKVVLVHIVQGDYGDLGEPPSQNIESKLTSVQCFSGDFKLPSVSDLPSSVTKTMGKLKYSTSKWDPSILEQVEHLGTTPDDYPTLLLGQDARKHLFPKRVPEGQLHVWNKSLPKVILSKSQITGKFIPEGVINHAPQAPKVDIIVNQCITVNEVQERE